MIAAVNNNLENVTVVLRKIRSTREELRSIILFMVIAIALQSIDGFNELDEATKVANCSELVNNESQRLLDLANSLIPEENKERILQLIDAEIKPKIMTTSAVNWIIDIANDPSHGYSQAKNIRFTGIDYDCASLVISAYEQAGIENIGSTDGPEGYNSISDIPSDILELMGYSEW